MRPPAVGLRRIKRRGPTNANALAAAFIHPRDALIVIGAMAPAVCRPVQTIFAAR